MAVHVITIQQSRPGKFDVRLGDDQRLFVESSAQPFLESAAALLSGGLALPTDELVMRFNGSRFEIRRGTIGNAVRHAQGSAPVRPIGRRATG